MNLDKERRGKRFFSALGDIFIPLLPGFITAGLCAGVCSLLKELIPDYQSRDVLNTLITMLGMINTAFTFFLSAWVGLSASKRFGGTPILGGILGMATTLEGINVVSEIVGLNSTGFLGYPVLQTGSGGVMAVILGAWALCNLEKLFNRILPKILRYVLTPILSFLICFIPFVFLLMPAMGFVTGLVCKAIEFLIFNDSSIVRLLTGYICAAMFLPLNLMGMHFALIPIYALELETFGHISLIPVIAMAGASQVGAGFCVILKSAQVRNDALKANAIAGIIPGMLGIGNPLMYGVSLPHFKVFISACIGAGFGGAFMVLMHVFASGWGPSGLLALPLMTAGRGSALRSMLFYFLGLCLSCAAGFITTLFLVPAKELRD